MMDRLSYFEIPSIPAGSAILGSHGEEDGVCELGEGGGGTPGFK